jgi:hypothetical protein
MKKSIGARFGVASPLSAKTTQLKTYGCIAIVCLAGCTTTQVRWDAIGMRQQVMKYYNDEIVENLIRAREKLPFVHLDITGLTTIATSQLSGTIGAGETEASTKTSRSMIGALSTLSRAVTYPFAYSVSPQRGNSLQISAAPVLGPLAADGATSSKKTIKTEETAPTQVNGKQTTTKTITTDEEALKPQTTTIYSLYDCFLKKHPKALVGPRSLIPHPSEAEFVEGTLKIWHGRYYYVDKNYQTAYFVFCTELFTKTQTSSVAKQLQATETAVEGFRGLQALPQSPR